MKIWKVVLIGMLIFLVLPFSSAMPYIVGFVNNSYDGESANGHTVVLWNSANGISDNLTDIIGVTGNSGADNIFMIDCDLLNSPCAVGDEMSVRVLDSGDSYISSTSSVSITGAGFEMVPNMRINSFPNVSLVSPFNNQNLSERQVEFNCSGGDFDSNLANITLWGNWTGWNPNQTVSVSGKSDSAIFKVNLSDGHYQYSCQVKDDLGVYNFSSTNYTFSVDTTPPVIDSISFNQSYACGTLSYIRVNCTTYDETLSVDKVIIEAHSPSGMTNFSANLLSGNTYYSDILINELGDWDFNCISNDTVNNINNLSSLTLEVDSSSAELNISYQDIIFSNLNPKENQEIIINATIQNNGCGDSGDFLTGFYNGDPSSNGVQINQNKTTNIPGKSSKVVNMTWNAVIGPNNIFVLADVSEIVNEGNETNNKANKTLDVNSWQNIFGNVSVDKILGFGASNISLWVNQSNLSGNVFITDKEADVDWLSLQSIGRDRFGANSADDFSEIDISLGMDAYSDSVYNTFTNSGVPKKTDSFFIYQNTINNVSVINSTQDSNFVTGILWDMSDDFFNDEYDSTEKEDLIFVTKINKGAQGAFGKYDYELSIPVKLREYESSDTSEVYLYYDLN